MNRTQIWFRESPAGHWVAYVADAPRIEGKGLTKDEALGAMVREHAGQFLVVADLSGDASDVMASEHGSHPECIEVVSG